MPLLLAAAALTGCSSPSRAPVASPVASAVACGQLSTLRALHGQLQVAKNAATGNAIEYLVVGDGARSNDVLVYFPGTGQMVPGWPIQLITNRKYSPRIARTPGYRREEDGSLSLCHDYRLAFFDYPGVGLTARSRFTKDDVASDVDAMLQDITRKYRISTAVVDPIGWSLGTTNALKYAFLSPVARPSRRIHNVILYSAHGGGSEQAGGSGQASCVLTLFDASLVTSGKLNLDIKGMLTKLIFPFAGQTPDENGTESNCHARVTKQSAVLNVDPVCTIANGCRSYIASYLAGVLTDPWRRTKGIDDNVYAQERQQSGDWNVVYCARALPHFVSSGCTAYGTVQQSVTNGGICKTNTSNVDRPVSVVCDTLDITGKVTTMDGYEDLLVQWKYDKALVDGLNAAKPNAASLRIYPGSAGHGLLIEHPGWAEAQTSAAMQR